MLGYARKALDTVKGNDPVSVFPRQQHRVWFERALAAAKIMDYSWHTNRHNFCSRLAMAGVPLFTIAQIAGHRDIKVTMRYAHLSPGHNLEAVQKLVKPTPKVTPASEAQVFIRKEHRGRRIKKPPLVPNGSKNPKPVGGGGSSLHYLDALGPKRLHPRLTALRAILSPESHLATQPHGP